MFYFWVGFFVYRLFMHRYSCGSVQKRPFGLCVRTPSFFVEARGNPDCELEDLDPVEECKKKHENKKTCEEDLRRKFYLAENENRRERKRKDASGHISRDWVMDGESSSEMYDDCLSDSDDASSENNREYWCKNKSMRRYKRLSDICQLSPGGNSPKFLISLTMLPLATLFMDTSYTVHISSSGHLNLQTSFPFSDLSCKDDKFYIKYGPHFLEASGSTIGTTTNIEEATGFTFKKRNKSILIMSDNRCLTKIEPKDVKRQISSSKKEPDYQVAMLPCNMSTLGDTINQKFKIRRVYSTENMDIQSPTEHTPLNVQRLFKGKMYDRIFQNSLRQMRDITKELTKEEIEQM